MQRGSRFALAVADAALVLFVLLYGALIVLVVLRPWLDDMRGLLLGHSPADLVAFVAGIVCITALRQFSSTELHFDSTGRVWLYVVLSLIALAIFVRFIYPGRRAATRTA